MFERLKPQRDEHRRPRSKSEWSHPDSYTARMRMRQATCSRRGSVSHSFAKIFADVGDCKTITV